MSIRECVNESKRLMSGKIWEYFVLELSFILWLLLVSVTCGIAILYVGPYMQITMAGYYLSLKPAQPVGDSAFDGTAAALHRLFCRSKKGNARCQRPLSCS